MSRLRIMYSCVMLLCAGLLGQGLASAQDSSPTFTVSGTSTVRSWSCPASGTITASPGPTGPAVPGFPGGAPKVVITVPVSAIICPDEEMTEHVRETFKNGGDSEIVYSLEAYELAGSDMATATGTMTIDGVSRPVTFDINLESSAAGLRGEGEATIDLTEFDITPPAVWLGLLKVGKDVHVRFDAVLPAQ